MYTTNTLPTDGTSGPFPIGLNYLSGATITVSLADNLLGEDAVALDFTFVGTKTDDQPSGTSILLSASQAGGKYLIIKKTIDLDTPAVLWNQGAELSQKNLRRTTINLMEMAQAAYDKAVAGEITLAAANALFAVIEEVIPENVLAAGAAISADKVLAEQAALSAQATLAAYLSKLNQTITLDFGAGASEKTFVITSLTIAADTQVTVTQTAKPPASKPMDANEMDTIICKAYASGTNQITIYAKSLYGSVHGEFNFAIQY